MKRIPGQKKNRMQLLVLAILVQLFFNIFTNAYNLGSVLFGDSFDMPVGLIIFLNIILSVIAMYLIVNIKFLSDKEKELYVLQSEMKCNENLKSVLRELKHDINNQFCVINGLIQLGKVDLATSYYKSINKQFDWMDSLLELNQPEVASLILNKLFMAKNQDISVEVKVDVRHKLRLSSEILTRTVGNLLDNAIEALVLDSSALKKLFVEVKSKENVLLVTVGNTGTITKEVSTKMFDKGFTTKYQDGHGLGLHIVDTLMKSSGGKVSHRVEADMVYFELNFPI